jgi:poly(ADP-ribose) glycohydrolase ARH3
VGVEGLRDRFRGAIVGTAVGDALGAPFEGRRSVDPRHVEAWERSSDPLRWTDDTHMTIAVAESLSAAGGFDDDGMAERFVAAHDAEPWRGYGPGPPTVFAAMRRGEDWRDAAGQLFGGAGSFGNGAAMRSAPIGLFACRDLPEAVRIARQAAGITHAHELGRQGAAVQAFATGWLATAHPEPGWWTADSLLDGLRQVAPDPSYQERFGTVARLPADAPVREVVAALGNGIAAVDSVPTALHAALGSLHSFPDAVGRAVRLGGDTDTIGAMAGALAGAFLGYSAIPRPWLDRLEAVHMLVVVADELLAAADAHGPGGGPV